MANIQVPPIEDVLNAFALEHDHGKETLERYLQEYPQYADEIVDLSFALERPINLESTSLTTYDLDMIEAAWQKHGKKLLPVANPFDGLSVEQLRYIATVLDVPRSVLSAFRERQIIISSVPKKFCLRLATALGQSIDIFLAFAESVVAPTPALRNYKSDSKPKAEKQVTFEQILIEAHVPEKKRQELLSEE